MYREKSLRWRNPLPAGDFDFRNLFRLTRELKYLGLPDPEACHGPLFEACDALAIDRDRAVLFVWTTWEVVQTTPAENMLTLAARKAAEHPLPLYDPRWTALVVNRRVASLAYWLGAVKAWGWFPFGDKAVGDALGVHRNAVGMAVKMLDKRFVEVMRDKQGDTVYSYSRGQARMVRYTGPKPEGRA